VELFYFPFIFVCAVCVFFWVQISAVMEKFLVMEYLVELLSNAVGVRVFLFDGLVLTVCIVFGKCYIMGLFTADQGNLSCYMIKCRK
jgi:hypothetical protein